MKRTLKVQQTDQHGKKLKSLSVLDALTKAEAEETKLLQAEQAATTAWTDAAKGQAKKEAHQKLEAARKATILKRNEVTFLRNLLEKEEAEAQEAEGEEEDRVEEGENA